VHLRTRRRWLRVLQTAIAGSIAGAFALSAAPAHAALPTPDFTGIAIDGYAPYDGQTTCDPTPKPGVVDFRNILLDEYPGRDTGISRDCSRPGQSEHKEGRALDFEFNAGNPTQAAQAATVLNWLLATDRAGNAHALLRRFGIMYIIWNHKIFSAHKASQGWQPYDGPNPHTDHIHFSFSWAGAREQTSWWRQRPSTPRYVKDYNRDGVGDFLALNGDRLHLYTGGGTGGFNGDPVGGGWEDFRLISGVGDTTRDGIGDFVAVKGDVMHLYTGTGAGFNHRVLGPGWAGFRMIAGTGDVTGDGVGDFVAVKGDVMYLYVGTGTGGFNDRVLGPGWADFRMIAGVGDDTGDGRADFVAVKGDVMYLYAGTGTGGFNDRVLGGGWAGFRMIAGTGDTTRDGNGDFVAVKGDVMHVYTGTGTGGFNGRPLPGGGWTPFRAIG